MEPVVREVDVEGDSAVELRVPAEARHLRLARLTASGLSADLGFGLDEVEELRLAVGEASALLVEHASAGARLTLRYRIEGDTLVVEGWCPADADRPIEIDQVARAVLANTVDEFDVTTQGDGNTFRLTKRAHR